MSMRICTLGYRISDRTVICFFIAVSGVGREVLLTVIGRIWWDSEDRPGETKNFEYRERQNTSLYRPRWWTVYENLFHEETLR